MAALGILGAGGQLQLFIASVYTTITGVRSIQGPDGVWHDIDVTWLQSPGRAKEFISGFFDGQTINMECIMVPANVVTLFTTNGGVTGVWRILFSNGSHADFNGYINKFAWENPLEEEVLTPFSIKVSGPVTFTP